ncbi:nitroreductase family protein [bacterium]|nr:nitroreductase family protein [bacterium]MBU1983147.1 nitroreductase family protein [bacterium]
MECLAERHSTREFTADPLPLQTLSNLLWAAFGVNREDGRRTAPSARNWQEADIYVFLEEGIYRYDATANRLQSILPGDHRAATGQQDFVSVAPLNLLYVSDLAKMGTAAEADKILYAAADVGFIAQNVYLYCASEGLAAVVRGLVNREELAKTLELRPDQRIILAQTIGYPQ